MGAKATKVLVAGPGHRGGVGPGPWAGVVVAGPDAAAVGEAVARWREEGVVASGFVGDIGDPAVTEMAAELFPGAEVVTAG